MAQSVAVGPLGSTIPMAYYPVGPIYPPGSAVLVEEGMIQGPDLELALPETFLCENITWSQKLDPCVF